MQRHLHRSHRSDRCGLVKVADDKVHAGLDVQYTYDELNRVTQAPEGTWNGSSITTKTRQSDWVLDQFGSFTTYKQDANGDGDWVDTVDINDNNTFDVGFKITARKDQKTTPETVSTPSNAANGTLTNDGRTDKMVRRLEPPAAGSEPGERGPRHLPLQRPRPPHCLARRRGQ